MIAQLKFVATYFVQSLYPAMIALIGFVLAQFGPPPVGSSTSFALNLLAWIGVATLIATLALTLKKLFGRQPSLNEILSGLVSTKTLAEYKEEQRLRCVGLEKQISEARHSFDERANADLVRYEKSFKEIFRRADERDSMMRDLSNTISRLQERTETHIRKLDQTDTKFDTLRKEVSETVGALRAARERLERDT